MREISLNTIKIGGEDGKNRKLEIPIDLANQENTKKSDICKYRVLKQM